MTPFASELISRVSTDRVQIAIGAVVFLVSFVASAAAVAFVVCRFPVDYLRSDPGVVDLDRPRWQRALRKLGKNALGVVLVLIGIALSLPGVPGQGLLTILIGMTLLDLPGKQRFERRLMTKPAVLAGINAVRARFRREPLLPPLRA